MPGNLIITQGYGATIGGALTLVNLTPAATQLVLTFSVNIALTGNALDPTNWSITPGSGSSPVTVNSLSVAGATLTINTTEHTNGTPYTLVFPQGVVSTSSAAPFIGPFTQAYTGVGVLPTLQAVQSIDARSVEAVFNEAVVPADALNPANWAITGDSVVAVVSVAQMTAASFRLSTTAHEPSSNYTLTASNIRDLAGNST